MIRDERGVAYVETLIALPAIFVVFAGLFTFAQLCAAQLVVQRAASAAARAAVVFLPDDKEYYQGNGVASQTECVKQAAKQVLLGAAHFKLEDDALEVKIEGEQREFEPIKVSVRAQYSCARFLGSFLCGADEIAHISSSAVLSYQEGPVEK